MIRSDTEIGLFARAGAVSRTIDWSACPCKPRRVPFHSALAPVLKSTNDVVETVVGQVK